MEEKERINLKTVDFRDPNQ